MVVVLPNGRAFFVRPIQPTDKAQLQSGLQRLSEETIRRRFLAAKPRFTAAELRYLTEIDGVDHIALAAVSPHCGRIVGVARAVRLPDAPDTAEWAIVIADEFQRMGLGSRLAELLADEAWAVDIRRFTATILGENEAVRRLMARVVERLDRDELNGAVREVAGLLAAA